MIALDLKPLWHTLSIENKNIVISRLLDILEVADERKRMNAARCILYLLQVCIFFFLTLMMQFCEICLILKQQFF